MISRRLLLGGLCASLGAALIPRGMRAAGPVPGRRFLFVFNPGGWDPLSALAPNYGAAGVTMPPATALATAGGLPYVDSAAANVRAFFEAWHARTLLLHGLSVPSVSHEICLKLMMTGQVSGARADWPTTLGAAHADGFTLPSLVLGGPTFPGALGVASARSGANGQLQGLLDGSIFGYTDTELPPTLSGPTARLLDRYAIARASARADGSPGGADGAISAAWRDSVMRARDLRDASFGTSFAATYNLDGQIDLALDVLSRGLSRVASVSSGAYGTWDTHQNNDTGQLPMFNALFASLSRLMSELASRQGPAGGTLADETVVVVLSEMGRTPLYNANAGRDHWPFTSVMILGDGVAGDRSIGAYDEAFFGKAIDPASGELDEGGTVPGVEHLGATLMALGDVDPGELVPGIAPIAGALA